MRIVQDALAFVDTARAYQIDDVVLVILAGEKPTPCHTVTIERGLADVEPPAFAARLSVDPRLRCMQVVAPFEVHAAFQIGAARDEVVVHHRDGELLVPVDQAPPESDAVGSTRSLTTLLDGEPQIATGYSKSYDVAEAIRNALEQISSTDPPFPDWLSTYTVESMRVEVGGIAGFNHLAVVIKG